eukprot:CAMPEP_0180650290 /NCGR_PEP_ID=MMETSP1037_2-20121125/52134_1 /TAXON_ID=632150 /ORGANISM="Azadinium spinosum, Strain 3D9" /LENGTH=188 /DNA_ID=CAMNT_0022675585 /DNA_START=45 /DNA_END=608 /DNA_ORIENTATION=+
MADCSCMSSRTEARRCTAWWDTVEARSTASLVLDPKEESPLERVLSAYHEFKKRAYAEMKDGDKAKVEHGNMTQLDYIDDLKKMLIGDIADYDAHFVSQAALLAEMGGAKFPMDYLGRFDNIETELGFVFRIPNRVHLNVHHGPTDPLFRIKKTLLTEEVTQLICKYYIDDYCCFGFAFPEPCKRSPE